MRRRRTTAALAVAAAALVAVVAPTQCTPKPPAVEVRRGPTTARTVAFTFDAGSDTGYAATILDTLEAEHIHAAFGMTGTWAERNPALVRRMAAEGHLLLNHTYDHRSFTGASTSSSPLTAAQRTSELSRAEDAVRRAGGPKLSPWFRAPYGDTDASVLRDVGAAGYRWSVLWTVDSLGWKGLSAQAITDRCAKGAVNGAIFLFHVGSASKDAAALPGLIRRFRAGGWHFWRLDHLMGVGP